MNINVELSKTTMNNNQTHVPVLIIGCGFGGMALAIELKSQGMNDFVILERAGDIGGVWRDNSYPGAACDVVSRFYSFSFDRNREWSENFAPQAEIWKYQKWYQPFVWIGMNSITIYLANNIIGFRRLASRFVGGDVKSFLDTQITSGLGDLVISMVGLALVKSLIECHGGKLEIESALHKGTLVRLILPPERTIRRGTALSA